MSQTDLIPETQGSLAPTAGRRFQVPLRLLAAIGGVALVFAFFLAQSPARLLLEVFGTALLSVSAMVGLWQWQDRRETTRLRDTLADILEEDEAAAFVTDSEGLILQSNEAAQARFRGRKSETLGGIFTDLFASPTAVLHRMQSKAVAVGSAKEDVVTRRGHIRIRVSLVEGRMYLWRIDDIGEKGGSRALDGLTLPMLTAGPSGTILYMNEAFRRLLGGRAKKLEGVFEDLPLVSGQTHKIRAANGTIECLVAEIPSHGGRREVYLLPGESMDGQSYAGGDGSVPQWDAIDELPVPLLKVALDGRIISSNREARVLLDIDLSERLRMADLFRGLGRPIVDWLQEAAAGKSALKPEFLERNSDTREQFVQIALNPAEEEEEPCVIAVLNDVTELKTLEQQFVQSQKMQAIGQLAGGVAHDFNNLLTAISGHCDLLLLRHDNGDPDYADLIQIHQNANRAAGLVGQLLAYSRKQNMQPEVLDLRTVLSDSAHLLNRLVGEKVNLTLDHDPGLEPIRADRRQLEQVMMNLVVNARDAMPDGGEIRIETAAISLDRALERDKATVPPGNYAAITVSDTGVGMDADLLKRIFEPFVTTKKAGEGTGLGLSTVYGIIKQTGGFIFVDSEPGQGTSFRIYMPIYDGPLEVSEPDTVKDPVLPMGQAEGVVLLVEDEAPVRAFASRALRLRGYTVIEAENAEAALEILADGDLQVDVFVTDVIMPGMDGPSWVRTALESRPGAKVVFVSGYAEETFSEDQRDIPNSVFLPKPFSLADLTRTVHEQLH